MNLLICSWELPVFVGRRLHQVSYLGCSLAGKPLIDGTLLVSIQAYEQMQHFWGMIFCL